MAEARRIRALKIIASVAVLIMVFFAVKTLSNIVKQPVLEPGEPVYLAKGSEINKRIRKSTTHVKFTNTPVPDGERTFDLSAGKDGSVLGYYADDYSSSFMGNNDIVYKNVVLVVTAPNGGEIMAHEDCSNMFKDTEVSIDLTNLNASNTKNMSGMFQNYGRPNLIFAERSQNNISTGNVTDMSNMFAGCEYLEHLELCSFNTSNVVNMSGMFDGCKRLESLYVSDFWNTDVVENSENMFRGCVGIKGAISYDSNKTDADMANYNTGYLKLDWTIE